MGHRSTLWTGLVSSWLALIAPFSVWAFTQTMTPGGHAVHWSSGSKLNLVGNPTNASGLTPDEVRSAVVRGLQRWQSAAQGRLGFDYWQGTNPSIYLLNSDYNGYSNIYFASMAQPGAVTPNVLGLTQVWYNTNNGEILETDIVLNDRDFRFTTRPTDTSGYGTGSPSFSAGRPNVYIENVITHELGHAFGLSHTEGLQSTMLFMESPEQAHLGCDDQVAIDAIYLGGAGRGAISGSVASDSGSPVFGANVLAISQKRGVVLATALTNASGEYSISGLEPGTYFLMVEPFVAGAQVLPSFYSGLDTNVCSAHRNFVRSFLTDLGGNKLLPVSVAAGSNVSVPTVQSKCSSFGGAAVSASSAAGSGLNVMDGSAGGTSFGVVDLLESGTTLTYVLKAIHGRIDIHALSYSLYSPVRPQMRLYSASGSEVRASISQSVYTGDSGYTNFDSALSAEGLETGDYRLEVSGSNVLSTLYPAGPMLLDGTPFVVISGVLNDGSPVPVPDLPANARCRMDENFAAYASPPGDPPRANTTKENGETGFCGTIDHSGRKLGAPELGGGKPRPPVAGAPAAEIFGWFVPWLFMLAMVLIQRLRIRRSRSAIS